GYAEVTHRLDEIRSEAFPAEPLRRDSEHTTLDLLPARAVADEIPDARCLRISVVGHEGGRELPETEPLGADAGRHNGLAGGDRLDESELEPRAEAHRGDVHQRAVEPRP